MDKNKQQVCSIIITTYNGVKWIEKCIASCKESDYPVNIIVVDNNSTDNTLELLPKDIHLIKLSTNVGFGRANNIGMMEAFQVFDAQYVFLLNQDAYIKKNTITELVKCHQENPHFGLISPFHFGEDWKEYDYRFKIYLQRSKSHKIKEHREKCIYHSKFVNAAAWFLTRETVLKNGGFDPIFFHTGEDDNFCQRLRKHKIPIFITEKAAILHDRQDRKKQKTPPHLKVANRSKIIIYNPDINGFLKITYLIPLAFFYLINLTLPAYRTKKKLKHDYNELKGIINYASRCKKLYQTDGVFLRQDYPPTFLKD
ncbi:MAG: GT2 family glycosyltransferase [Maribacter sp.]